MSELHGSEGLDEQAVKILDQWATNSGREWRIGEFLTEGATDTVVATMYLNQKGRATWASAPRRMKVVVKVCPPARDDRLEVEAGIHWKALEDAPERFRKDHLLRQPHDPLPLGDGRILMFQEYGTDGGVTTLSMQLDNTELLIKRCGSIVRALLDKWNVDAQSVQLTASEFLRRQLRWRLEPKSRLRTWIASQAAAAPEAGTTTDPIELALGAAGNPTLDVPIGRIHGDLHPGNLLVPKKSRPSAFRLIDLSQYMADTPLATDPVHFLLSIVIRKLPPVSPMRDRLIDYLVAVDPDRYADLPLPLLKVNEAIRKAGRDWSASRGLTDEWNQQITLSLVGCGLVYAGYRTLPEDVRAWCFRLAEGATRAFLAELGIAPPTAPRAPAPPEHTPPSAGLGGSTPEDHRPASSGDDLADLSSEQVELLRASTEVLEEFLERFDNLVGTSPYAPQYAHMYGRMQRTLATLRQQLEALEESVQAQTWPHAEWAINLASLRARAQGELSEVEQCMYGNPALRAPVDRSVYDLRTTITTLQQTVANKYPGAIMLP